MQLALELKNEISSTETRTDDLRAGKVDQSIVNHIYGGNVVVAANVESFSQVQNISVAQNDIQGLVAALKELGLLQADVAKLKSAIDDDKKSGSSTIGRRTAEWLKDLHVSLGKGTLKVGVYVAKGSGDQICT